MIDHSEEIAEAEAEAERAEREIVCAAFGYEHKWEFNADGTESCLCGALYVPPHLQHRY